jgi:protein Tex
MTSEKRCFRLGETPVESNELFEEVSRTCQLPPSRVQAAIELLDEGNTIPFLARYRKEKTGGLDELDLRRIEDAVTRLRELEARKQTVLQAIRDQGKLHAALEQQILACPDKKLLEELYLPFKTKRRTRAEIARNRGLEPLAQLLASQVDSGRSRQEILKPFVSEEKEVPDAESALKGACDILAEQWAENPEIRQAVRRTVQRGLLVSRVRKPWQGKPSKFENYYDYREPLSKVPAHRLLAMRRGEAEEVLRLGIEVDDDAVVQQLSDRLVTNRRFQFRTEMLEAVKDSYQRLLFPSIESSVLGQRDEAAEDEAIQVFSQNLRELLLAPPAGPRVVMGIDPGFRTGCKVAVVDSTGKFLHYSTIYPTPPHSRKVDSARVLLELIDRHGVELIALGTGTASRETDAFLVEMLKENPRQVAKVSVNESGASIYSASDVARAEFPELDATVRGAISIARRLQDPLAELVKVDPKSMGVGQYQHDVNQTKLKKALDRDVESCVNRVGVDLNTASCQLLSYVSGIGPKLAESIVAYRHEHGQFTDRAQLLAVPRLGQKAYEQSAGFLRVRGGTSPLDNSSVHPESYYVVEKMAAAVGASPEKLVGNVELLRQLDGQAFVDERVGLPTVRDILSELEKPGRDPRQEFRVAEFAEGVNEIGDLVAGMELEGVVTNVTRFGAFVDIGVHQDGLIHISELDNRFIQDPSEVVAVGEIVNVRVLQVDKERSRIALSRKQCLPGR